LEQVRDWAIRWRVFRRWRAELLQHDHRELYDLGIGPGDVDRVAWRGAHDAVPRPIAKWTRAERSMGLGA
jgi:uncharacterized protein YjiS (DUF1127 family)